MQILANSGHLLLHAGHSEALHIRVRRSPGFVIRTGFKPDPVTYQPSDMSSRSVSFLICEKGSDLLRGLGSKKEEFSDVS